MISAMYLTKRAYDDFQTRDVTRVLQGPPVPWLWYKRASDATPTGLEFGPIHQKEAAPVAAYWRLKQEPDGMDRWERMG